MRTLIRKSTTSLVASLAAGALVVSAPTAASASAPSLAPTAARAASTTSTSASTSSATTAAAAAPVSIKVSYPYRVRAGRVVSFKVTLVNKLKTRTDEIFLAAKFPKNVTKARIYVPQGSRYNERCTRERIRALCVLPGLKKGRSYTFWAKAWVSGSARGKLYGYFGGAVTDTPLNTDPKQLLNEFGGSISWVKTKSTITR
ncbi:hypothetical protein F5972_22960 [Microbispora cellulosiformans]|uniref:DUF11 domain-containing protein n=1 Tax=Microbispora cellulosiformans TaxID=2614688 RepID=A0A5J5K062_9ACTN|nr:hypothetical protein [Microbispora cellulosiformans]KAA9376297.1 hypothetical protein F5972_22960 [Microbispora cellulosiformans]